MAIYNAHVNEEKLFRVIKSDLGEIGPDWVFNWTVERTSDPGDKSFYSIVGVDKSDEDTHWSYDPFVKIIFYEETEPGEHFEVTATVKIIKDGNEICEPILTVKVLVEENNDDFDCAFLSVPTCMEAGELYTFTVQCDKDKLVPDFIDFYVENGVIFSDSEYHTAISVIPVLTDNGYEGQVQVRWNENPTTPNGYTIKAVLRKVGKLKQISETHLKVLPSKLNIQIDGPFVFYYNTGDVRYDFHVSSFLRFAYNVDYESSYYIYPAWVDETALNGSEVFTQITSDELTTVINTYDDYIELDTTQNIGKRTLFIKVETEDDDGCTVSGLHYIQFENIGCVEDFETGNYTIDYDYCLDDFGTDFDKDVDIIKCYLTEEIIDYPICPVFCTDTLETEDFPVCPVYCIDTLETEDFPVCPVYCTDTLETEDFPVCPVYCTDTLETEDFPVCPVYCNDTLETEDFPVCPVYCNDTIETIDTKTCYTVCLGENTTENISSNLPLVAKISNRICMNISNTIPM